MKTFAAIVIIAVAAFRLGMRYERASLCRQMQAAGAVGAPGNALGLPSTNYVRVAP